jgi:hypothetical protein
MTATSQAGGGEGMTDKQGRAYLKIREAKPAMTVELDGDFSCVRKGAKRVLLADRNGGLFFNCQIGAHYLSGQRRDNYYIGVYPA